jgi:hypothetical protein
MSLLDDNLVEATLKTELTNFCNILLISKRFQKMKNKYVYVTTINKGIII